MTALVQVRIDKELKEQAEELFSDLGLDMTTALRMFIKAAVREQKIPFKLAKSKPDPIYHPENVKRILESAKEIDSGKAIVKTMDELWAMCENTESHTPSQKTSGDAANA